MRSTFTIFSNGSIIQPGFKFTELHAPTLAAHFLCACCCCMGRSVGEKFVQGGQLPNVCDSDHPIILEATTLIMS